jgi:hypothetical protein
VTVFGKKAAAKVMVCVDGPILKADGEFLLVRRDANSGEWVRLQVQEGGQKLFVGLETRRFWCEVGPVGDRVQVVRLTNHVGRTGLFRYVRS